MKASVYIPDDLWDLAQQQEGFKLSSFVQDALRQRFDRSQRPYARLSEALVREREATREKVQRQITSAYVAGYQLGLVLAEQLPWEAFVDLEGLGWDLAKWQAQFDDSGYPIVDRADWADDAQELDFDDLMSIVRDEVMVPVYGFDSRGLPVGVVGEGCRDALRDVWSDSAPRDISRAAEGDDGEESHGRD
jgi:hypothetical protein